nr:hypothetical protein [Tanacetum cinerariifolium]
ELLSKINDINEAMRGLKKYVEGLEIKIPGDLKEIPEKLEEFRSSAKLAHPAKGEKNTKQATITQLFQRSEKDATRANLNKETIIPTTAHETTVIPLVTTKITLIIPTMLPFQSPFLSSPLKTTLQPEGEQVKKDKGKKALSHKEADEEESVSDSETKVRLTGNGPITLKVYKDDGFDEMIQNFKSSDLHLGEWRENRMENLHNTEKELELDFSKPLGEWDLINNLNTLTKKKRKHADEFHDYLRQDFVSIEDFGTNDLARTFNTFLVAEVEKRNLNPNKQIRLIEQLKQ